MIQLSGEIDVDLEAAEGANLPKVSAAAVNPRTHSDYIDRRLNAIGFGFFLGGFILYCEGIDQPLFVPDAQFNLGATQALAIDQVIYASRDDAVSRLPAGPLPRGAAIPYAYYRAHGLIVPTTFTPETTPRVISTADRAIRDLANQIADELTVVAISIVGGMLVRAIISRLARIGAPRAPTKPPAQIGRDLISANGGSVRRALPNLNSMRLSQDDAATAVEAMFRQSGRNVANRVRMKDGNLVLTSVRPGNDQPVNVVSPQGQVSFAKAKLSLSGDLKAPISVTDLKPE